MGRQIEIGARIVKVPADAAGEGEADPLHRNGPLLLAVAEHELGVVAAVGDAAFDVGPASSGWG
jgi:hypothetical protein